MLKCIAIDDEPIALSIIREYCGQYGDIELECFSSPEEGMRRIVEARPDIVFLDIEMNSHNGMALARELPEGVSLIFTTAYSKYALEGFEVDAVDFLHKPIFYERFARAVDKARRWLGEGSEKKPEAPKTISLRADYRNVMVDLADIIYIEAMDNYVKVVRRNMPTVVSQITMKEMEAMLPEEEFIRIHRSYIVSVKAVDSFSSQSVTLRNHPKSLPVGRTYAASLNKIKP